MSRPALLYVHLHVPKCAGGAVNLALRRRFDGRFLHVASDQNMRDEIRSRLASGTMSNIDTIMGHIFFDIASLTQRQFLCFSAVREPLARICSFFNYIHTQPDHKDHLYFKSNFTNINQISKGIINQYPQYRNLWSNNHCKHYYQPWNSRNNDSEPDWKSVWDSIEQRIDKQKLEVGSLTYITNLLHRSGILHGALPKQKVTRVNKYDDYDVATVDTLTSDTRDLLLEWNQYDYFLLEKLEDMGRI